LDPSKIGTVVLKSGERIAADIVIVGVGARPHTDFLKNTEISLHHDGGIRVNSYLQVEGFHHVFAGGISLDFYRCILSTLC
jgi:NADPH-dependent 2,4-dienoyl-CoA reductase/sulfur reductase-like enzyme